MKKERTFHFYTDPGHGWLKVRKSEINNLGLGGKITNYSYMKNGWAYLEEDCDAELFIKALEKLGTICHIKYHHTNTRSSRIRSYSHYEL